MTLSSRRRRADLAAHRANERVATYRQSVEQLHFRLRRDWKLPLATGLGAGVIAGIVPLAATLRAAGTMMRLALSLSRVPYAALTRLARSARAENVHPD